MATAEWESYVLSGHQWNWCVGEKPKYEALPEIDPFDELNDEEV